MQRLVVFGASRPNQIENETLHVLGKWNEPDRILALDDIRSADDGVRRVWKAAVVRSMISPSWSRSG